MGSVCSCDQSDDVSMGPSQGRKATTSLARGHQDKSDSDSRPPTPFSRPITAAVLQRPGTTTIFERDLESSLVSKDSWVSQSDAVAAGSEAVAHEDPNKRTHRAAVTSTDPAAIAKLKEYMHKKGL